MIRHALALVCLCPMMVFCQSNLKDATIITNSGDSMHVKIQDKQSILNPHTISVHDASTNQALTFTPLQIRSIAIQGGDLFVSAVVDLDQMAFNTEYYPSDSVLRLPRRDTVFLKAEYQSNSYSLFSFSDKNRLHLLIQGRDGKFDELIYRKYIMYSDGTGFEKEEKEYTVQLSHLLSDCPQVSTDALQASYTIQSVEGFLIKYNSSCHKESTGVFMNVREPMKLQLAIFSGGSFCNPVVTANTGYIGGVPLVTKNSLKGQMVVPVGIRLNAFLPGFHQKFSVVADLFYSACKAGVTDYLTYYSPILYSQESLSLNINYMRFHLMPRYYFSGNKNVLRPFIDAGVSFAVAISHNSTVTIDEFYNDAHHSTTSDPFVNNGFKNSQFGFIGGLGAAFKRWSLEYRYESTTGFTNYEWVGSSYSSHSVLLAYAFH